MFSFVSIFLLNVITFCYYVFITVVIATGRLHNSCAGFDLTGNHKSATT